MNQLKRGQPVSAYAYGLLLCTMDTLMVCDTCNRMKKMLLLAGDILVVTTSWCPGFKFEFVALHVVEAPLEYAWCAHVTGETQIQTRSRNITCAPCAMIQVGSFAPVSHQIRGCLPRKPSSHRAYTWQNLTYEKES